MNRSKKAVLNLAAQLLLQATVAICGFVVPKLILEGFGSDVNGIVTSISQFLGIIALLETGFGGVAKAAFYKPLASGDRKAISGVYNATESFFRKIALIFALYCVVLSVGFPLINDGGFDFWFTATLVLILGISSFAQYYFGMSYSIALNADQLSFIGALLQVGAVILNAVITVVLLNLGAGIHVVKLVSASVFVLKPIVINLYGRHRYRVDKKVPKDDNSLSQKWDNLAQGIASYVHTKASYVLMTIFMTFREVSVYSVYSLVTTSLSSIITSISTGFVSGLGNMYANGEKENYKKVFSLYEFVNTIITFGFFTVACITMMRFVDIYTMNLTDVDYHRPVFGTILVVAELLYCLRLPYYYAIGNAGHFKQTKRGAWIEAIINISLSLILLPFLGIIGLAIGTAVAMAVRSTDLIIYCCKNITEMKCVFVMKRMVVNFMAAIASIGLCSFIGFETNDFVMWIVYACLVSVVTFGVVLAVNLIFYREDAKLLFKKIRTAFSR